MAPSLDPEAQGRPTFIWKYCPSSDKGQHSSYRDTQKPLLTLQATQRCRHSAKRRSRSLQAGRGKAPVRGHVGALKCALDFTFTCHKILVFS